MRLKFQPVANVLSDKQIHAMLGGASAPEGLRDPARRTFFRTALAGAAAVVPALLLGSRSCRAAVKRRSLPELYPGQNMTLFQEILKDESVHVEILRRLTPAPAPIRSAGSGARPGRWA
jgi:hypothetical protein